MQLIIIYSSKCTVTIEEYFPQYLRWSQETARKIGTARQMYLYLLIKYKNSVIIVEIHIRSLPLHIYIIRHTFYMLIVIRIRAHVIMILFKKK